MTTLTTTIDGQVVRWKDHKRYQWLFGLVVPLLPFGAAQWVDFSGWSNIFWYSGPIWILVMIPILDRIFNDTVKVLSTAELRDSLGKLLMQVAPSKSPEAYTAFVRAETAKWAKVIRENNIKVAE